MAPAVVIVNYAFDKRLATPERTLEGLVALREYVAGLCEAGLKVSVVQRFARSATLSHAGVEYEFVAEGERPRPRPRSFDACPAVARRAALAGAELAHVNGLVFPLQTRLLAARLGPGVALVAQHHGEAPWQGWRSALQRWGLAPVEGFLFTSAAQAEPWRQRGVIGPKARTFEVMEGSTGLTPRPRAQARASLPLPGAPALLWVGRLVPVKDPLTLVAGFELLLDACPDAHLTIVYGEADLLPQVEARLAASRRLQRSVTLAGRLTREELAWYYASADYFVAASRREGSGFALAEALASGLVPIVTAIPSFEKMTAQGAFGGLWRAGDPHDFARVATEVLARPREPLARAAAAHFEAHLSRAAIGRQARAAYESVLAARGGGA